MTFKMAALKLRALPWGQLRVNDMGETVQGESDCFTRESSLVRAMYSKSVCDNFCLLDAGRGIIYSTFA